uniref:Uncharacterized protein n=1 Tax=Ixodes ricinus TaxID=34613 RepID=A0A6B0TQT7_IXORI
MIMPAVLLGTRIFTCFSLSAGCLWSKSMAIFAVGSGFSLIFSMINSCIRRTPSTLPVIRQTLSVVPG